VDPPPATGTDIVADTLRERSVHDQWEGRYRARSDAHRRRLFDFVASQVGDPAAGPVLDAGCGPAVHAIELARRGFTVLGIDSSPAALELAHENVGDAGYSDKISLQLEDLLQLSVADGS